jgi:hypothetical protein
MNNIVYIVQDSPGKNLLPAKEYGELFILLNGNESTPQAIDKLRTKLSAFSSKDSLLLIGNPMFIGLAMLYAHEKSPTINVLLWDREHYRYNKESIKP